MTFKKNQLAQFLFFVFACIFFSTSTYAAKPLRIVSAAPSVTEILFELKLGNCVVGRTSSCDYPAEAARIPSIGQFNQPNMETILFLTPTLLITENANISQAETTLRQAGIRVMNLKINNFEQLFTAILEIGQATQTSEKAQVLVKRMQADLAKIATSYQTQPISKRPRVFVELWYNPLTTAGGHSFVNEVIRRAGGVNTAQMLSQPYPQVNPEDVLAWNPDVILVARMLSNEQGLTEIKNRIGWNSIKAVANNQIITGISSDYLLRPGPRLILGVKLLAEQLHKKP